MGIHFAGYATVGFARLEIQNYHHFTNFGFIHLNICKCGLE